MRSNQRPRRALIGKPANHAAIVNAFNRIGFDVWFKLAAAKSYSEDPWLAFSSACATHRKVTSSLRSVIDLFIRRKAVDQNSIERSLGKFVVDLLKRYGVLERSESGQLWSRFCLLSSFDMYLFVEWPLRTKMGRLISHETYLSNSSYETSSEIQKRRSVDTALDLGCGCGITTMMLSRIAKKTIAVDVDSAAIDLTKLNLAVNDCKSDVFHCDWNNLGLSGARFDFINANPPWRIVPPSVNYPNAVARAGKGRDSLDYVRQIFAVISKFLASQGEAVVRFDLPQGIPEAEDLLSYPERTLGPGFTIRPMILRFISNEDQAKVSAGMCAHLNAGVTDLSQVFLRHYQGLNVKGLVSLMCIIQNHNS
jgi:methylase of polypeptide subunit release factors